MAKKRRSESMTVDQRKGGVYIGERARVDVGGDLVGGNKNVPHENDEAFEELFAQLIQLIQTNHSLKDEEKQEAIAQSQELKAELKKQEPDLGKVSRIKQFLLSKGSWIMASVGAIFQYPPVQETIKTLAQRLIGA